MHVCVCPLWSLVCRGWMPGNELARCILQGKVEFDTYCGSVSSSATDLLTSLLDPSPDNRPSADDTTEHAWFLLGTALVGRGSLGTLHAILVSMLPSQGCPVFVRALSFSRSLSTWSVACSSLAAHEATHIARFGHSGRHYLCRWPCADCCALGWGIRWRKAGSRRVALGDQCRFAEYVSGAEGDAPASGAVTQRTPQGSKHREFLADLAHPLQRFALRVGLVQGARTGERL